MITKIVLAYYAVQTTPDMCSGDWESSVTVLLDSSVHGVIVVYYVNVL